VDLLPSQISTANTQRCRWLFKTKRDFSLSQHTNAPKAAALQWAMILARTPFTGTNTEFEKPGAHAPGLFLGLAKRREFSNLDNALMDALFWRCPEP